MGQRGLTGRDSTPPLGGPPDVWEGLSWCPSAWQGKSRHIWIFCRGPLDKWFGMWQDTDMVNVCSVVSKGESSHGHGI